MVKNKESLDDMLVTKKTMEDTFKYQEKLRKLLETLISENRCLSYSEIDDYHFLLSHSTLGLGASKTFTILTSEGFISPGSVEYVARFLARQKTNPVLITLPGSLVTHKISIYFLWERLLDYLFEIFPLGIEKSASMSRESDATLGGDAFGFDPEL